MLQWCHLRNLSIVSVLLLTVCNVLLTQRLLHNSNCSYSEKISILPIVPKAPQITSAPCLEYNFPDEISSSKRTSFFEINLNAARWDNQRMLKYFDFVVVGEKFNELSEQFVVCLATQSSVERLYSLVQVAEYWAGPISAAVYVAGDDEFYILELYLAYLRLCFASIREKVSFHLAIPKGHQPTINKWPEKNLSGYDCDNPEAVLSKLLKLRTLNTIKWRLKNGYPQNNMRNLARKGCQGEYVFLTDVDIIPSLNFTEHLDKFLRNVKCTKLCAYVVPTYEIDLRVKFPSDKLDLIRLVKKGLARPFHQKVFIYNQYATNFSRWQMDLSADRDTYISHTVTNFEFLYEPFYVARDNVPSHDERFVGYGFTRNSQVYEMFVAGYQFQVLSPIFTCHWGLQNKKTRPAWREQQNNVNRRQFEAFKREILARYKKDKTKIGRV